MSIVKVSGRRIYIPKGIPFDAEKVIIIPVGDSLLIVPIYDKPIEIEIDKSIDELKRRAEEMAKLDAKRRQNRE